MSWRGCDARPRYPQPRQSPSEYDLAPGVVPQVGGLCRLRRYVVIVDSDSRCRYRRQRRARARSIACHPSCAASAYQLGLRTSQARLRRGLASRAHSRTCTPIAQVEPTLDVSVRGLGLRAVEALTFGDDLVAPLRALICDRLHHVVPIVSSPLCRFCPSGEIEQACTIGIAQSAELLGSNISF